MDLTTVAPQAYAAMIALDEAAARSLDAVITHLVKIRASQVNGCAFCVDLHTRQARASGEVEQRLDLLATWRRATCYTGRERAALALTEAVTRLTDPTAVDAAAREAAEVFDAVELAHLRWTIAAINAWNRTAVAAGLTAPPPARVESPAG